ncbi:PPE family protein [Mycobacterium crocinum]|uniref:PPE family protein n=1 Tax=Mycolicibacterium crocinum TaxID=388459 RepID=A0ABY3TN94_9MYCO|nr:PPE family protein [Mycolicibacterium crocinum]MCV7217189.1 PPE family protein [Mycolicibacterium crocinum]ULN42930.1 PPE family protein [Mycolicibacterium crocinum]
MNEKFRARIWMGAGIFALGVGAALTTGAGDASADSTGTSHSGVAHHQKRASAPSTPSRTTKPKNRTTVAGVRAKAVVDNPLTEQDKSIAEQDKAIAAQEKAFDNNARIAVFNFATLPPEVNSSRLYSGSSATAMLDAADAWNNLANGLNGAAQGFDRASQGLNSATWAGPVSAAMSNAASAYSGWLSARAGQAENAAAQASAGAAAYESAFNAGVPPSVIAANRAQLAQLAAVNVFTGNIPAIAATEAMYLGMWAQDVGAMVNYHPTPKP